MEPGNRQSGEDRSSDRQAWWTDADDAELDALVWELVDGIFEHRAKCATCAKVPAGALDCPHITRAISIVVDWRYRRNLVSRAEWLRRRIERVRLERALVGR